MKLLSVVIPAFNEAVNIPDVIRSVPTAQLERSGWSTELIVVDNASTDGTGDVARRLGARVVYEPRPGYGSAYMAGITAARGEVVATGDADCTYPFDDLPRLVGILRDLELDFLTTNRLLRGNTGAMKSSHFLGNYVLSGVSRLLFRNGLRDSQSGMWVFRRDIWDGFNIRCNGMAFSQELKNVATYQGHRYAEVPIEYRPRGGDVKLNALSDGVTNLMQLVAHRARLAGWRSRRGRSVGSVEPAGTAVRTGAMPLRPTKLLAARRRPVKLPEPIRVASAVR